MVKIGPDQWVKSNSHKGIISEEQFEAVQRRLDTNNRSKKYDIPLDHPFRRSVRCEGCNRIFTPYVQKGRLYYSSRCKKECVNTQRNINSDFISAQLGSAFSGFHLTESEMQELERETGGTIAQMVRQAEAIVLQHTKQRQKLDRDLLYLRENKLSLLQSGVYAPDQLADEERRLLQVISQLGEEMQSASKEASEIQQEFMEVSELLKYIANKWDFISLAKKDQISQILLSELKVGSKGLIYKLSPGFQSFDRRIYLHSWGNEWFSELLKSADQMIQARSQLEDVCRGSLDELPAQQPS